MRWLGLDLGTSSFKALVVDDSGRVLARSVVEYDHGSSPESLEEQDPRVWIDAAAAAVNACIAATGMPNGVGLCSQVPTVVLVDATGTPVRHALTWRDTRATAEAVELERALGPALPHLGMELPWSASHLPAKLLWLARHEPRVLERVALILQPKDYLGLVLTGSGVTDTWSSKGIVEVRAGTPARSVVEAAGWTTAVVPTAELPWLPRGTTQAGVFGLDEGIPVSVGWSDALASMLAVGAFSTPRAFVLSGTSDIVGLSHSGPAKPAPGLYHVPRECAPRPVVYGPTQSGGASLTWLSNLLNRPVDELVRLSSAANPDDDAVFVPYLDGERAPLWRTDVRAMLAGIGARHGAAEMARAVLRGVSLSAANILDIAADTNGHLITEIHVAGRDASSPEWQQIRLETLGVPIVQHPEPFTAALGAAMLGAAAAAGGSLEAGDHLRPEPTVVMPTEKDRRSARARLGDYARLSRMSQGWAER